MSGYSTIRPADADYSRESADRSKTFSGSRRARQRELYADPGERFYYRASIRN
jgi:hypothetical protein